MKDAQVVFGRLPESLINRALMFAALVLFSFSPLAAQGENEPLMISDLLLSNHTGTALVLSWRTNKPTTVNQVYYGLDKNNLDRVVADSVFQEPSRIHFVRLIWLQPDTIYYYRVKSDNLEFSVSPTGVDSVETFIQTLAQHRVFFAGQVTDQTGLSLSGILVRTFIRWEADSSMWYTVLTRPDGSFSFELTNYRDYDGEWIHYPQNEMMLHLSILGETQGALKDSVLLTAGLNSQQDLGTYQLIDVRKRAVYGRIHATSPVRADGRAASVVTVTILDDQGDPVPNVEVEIRVSGNETSVEGPFAPTDESGIAVGLVRSQVAQAKTIRVFNITADTTEIDTIAQVDFIGSLDDLLQDSTAPFIISTTVMENTKNNIGPYRITSRVVDNFDFEVKLLYTVNGNIFTDTLLMVPVSSDLPTPDNPDADLFYEDIPGQPPYTVIKYFVIAEDSSGNAATYPLGMLTDPFAFPITFEIVQEGGETVPRMGINPTTDAFSVTNPEHEVRIETRITSTIGISSAVIKWRNINNGTNFVDVPMTHFGANYWGYLPANPKGSHIQYFIQAVDSLGRIDRDRRRAPHYDLYSYEVLALDPKIIPSFVDTTNTVGTSDVRNTWYSVMVDLNDDTYADLVNANYGEANSIYFYNSRDGRLEEVTHQAFPTQLSEKTTHVAVADVDADDDLDIIFTNEGQQNRLYLNNGNGSFDDVTSRTFTPGGVTRMPTDNWSSTCVLADDFDGDGDIDFFIANNAFGGEPNRLLLNDSLGVFRDFSERSGLFAASLDKSVWAVAGDVDKDEDTDIVVINRAQGHVLLVNNGSGIFQVRSVADGSAPQATGADLGDVDGDGDLDLIIAQTGTQQNEFYLNNGRGGFIGETAVRLPSESDDTRAIKFFDVNADGYLDVYYVNYGQANRLLINDGLGHFSPATAGIIPSWESFSMAVAVGDLDQDNLPDLYISEDDRRNTVVFSRTLSIDLENLPSDFDLISPADGDTINTLTEAFLWHASHSPDTTDSISYTFFLALDSLFSSTMLVDQRGGISDTTVTIEDLTDDTHYWWKVTAENSLGIPVPSNQVHSLMVLESWVGDVPEFLVLVNRNPVFNSFMNIYIVSSVSLISSPSLTINLEPVSVTRQPGTNIWLAHYQTREGFLLSVEGTNLHGKTGEHTATLSAALAAAGNSTVLAATDGNAWLTLSTGAWTGEMVLFVQSHQPVKSEKIKARAAELGMTADLGYEDLAAIMQGDCYSFTSFDTRLKGSAVVSIKDRKNSGSGNSPTVCILENGLWVPLPTIYDNRTGAYSAVTDRLGIYALRSVNEIPGTQLPRGFTLAQNSPNPFNPSTCISYTVPAREGMSRVRLNVYNLRGALVQVLVDARQASGIYAVEWDGRERDGRALPSGVYFYRLESEDMVITRKMVLIR